jgi:hypothetical protein
VAYTPKSYSAGLQYVDFIDQSWRNVVYIVQPDFGGVSEVSWSINYDRPFHN